MRIGIDIDFTLVETDKYWFNWLNKNYTQQKTIPNNNINYDLGFYYNSGVQDFFTRPDLYDNITVNPEIIKLINNWQKQGHDIVFISWCFWEHYESKKRLLERTFKDYEFINTKNKHTINVDIMIDDRNNVLNKFSDKTILIRVDTPYEQEEPLKPNVKRIPNIQSLLNVKNLYDLQHCL